MNENYEKLDFYGIFENEIQCILEKEKINDFSKRFKNRLNT